MGYRIAKSCALTLTPTLTPTAYVVLNRMAWAVLDKPQGEHEAGTYWAGWEWLGMPFDDGERTPDAVRTIVMRALRELAAKGYIKTLTTARRGQRQHYQITVDY